MKLVLLGLVLSAIGADSRTDSASVANNEPLLLRHRTTLKEAPSLHAKAYVRTIGEAAHTVEVDLVKPNQARIDSPTRLVIADGKQILIFDKKDKIYYRHPQTTAELKSFFRNEELEFWGPFFGEDGFDPVRVRRLGSRVRKGEKLEVVETIPEWKGERTLTYFLSPVDGLARVKQMEIRGAKPKSMLLEIQELRVGAAVKPERFAFEAPNGVRQLSYAEAMSRTTFTEMEPALALAEKLNRPLFVEFYSDENEETEKFVEEVLKTDRFKEFSEKRLVVARINFDRRWSWANKYEVTKSPTFVVLDPQGKKKDAQEGYTSAVQFFEFLNEALKKSAK